MHSGAVHWPEWCYKLPDVIWSRYQRQPWPVVVVVTRWTGRQLPSSRVPSRRCLSSRLSCPCIQTKSQDNLHPTTTCQLQDSGTRQPLDFRSSLCHPRLGPSDRLDDRGRSRPQCRLTKPQASRRQGLTLHGRHTARSTTPSSSHHPTTPPSEQSTCRSLRIRPSSTCRNRPRDQTPPPRHRESSPPPLSLDPFGTPLNTSSPLQGHPDQHNHLPLGPLHHRHQRRPPGPSPRPSCHHLPRRSPAHPLLDQPRSRTRRPHQPPDRSLQRLGPPQHHRLPL